MVASETAKDRRIRLRREYLALFQDPPPVMMMTGTEDEKFSAIEKAVAEKTPITIDWPDDLDT